MDNFRTVRRIADVFSCSERRRLGCRGIVARSHALSARGAVGRRARRHRTARRLGCAVPRARTADRRSLPRRDAATSGGCPRAIDFETLERADYFASLAAVAEPRVTFERIMKTIWFASLNTRASCRSVAKPRHRRRVALNPAVCYHVYAGLAGQTIASRRLITAQAGCWRHEGERHESLERGWAFTMREVVCIGNESDAHDFLLRSAQRALQLAAALGLHASVAPATDPFFAPTARGKQVLQRIKELKHELLLPIDDERTTAAASFNLHDTFFGEAFDLRLPDGRPATTACLAFGIERWTLAFFAAHGPDAAHWPVIPTLDELREASYA